MAYNETVITAKNPEHFDALKALLKTAFATPIRIFDEGWVANQLETERLGWGQRRTLGKLGYQTENMTARP